MSFGAILQRLEYQFKIKIPLDQLQKALEAFLTEAEIEELLQKHEPIDAHIYT